MIITCPNTCGRYNIQFSVHFSVFRSKHGNPLSYEIRPHEIKKKFGENLNPCFLIMKDANEQKLCGNLFQTPYPLLSS